MYTPIGIIHSPFQSVVGTPIQAAGAQGAAGAIELEPTYSAGLHDIETFSHIMLIYHLHASNGYSLQVTPFLDDQAHGIFATRSPSRPNPIGLSTVRLVGVSGHTLFIEDVDVVDGTPLLDIKPYVPAFDERNAERIGWYEKRLHNVAMRADDRFV
jgi:tRNA-Thr(GGU) m(6)t(6)A37 methyltransferase TsaA